MKKSRSVFLLVLNILGHSSFLQPFVPVTCKFILIKFMWIYRVSQKLKICVTGSKVKEDSIFYFKSAWKKNPIFGWIPCILMCDVTKRYPKLQHDLCS